MNSKRKFFYTAIIICCALLHGMAQNTSYTLSGVVRDGETGETLIGATVVAKSLNLGAVTNEYGFYSLTLPGGDSIVIEYSYVGFQAMERKVLLANNTTLNAELGIGLQLEEVVVKANSFEERLASSEMSLEALTVKEVKQIPVAFGESDILKVIQLKPGIPSGSEGTTGLFVRGGGADQNLILLDEAVVYNPNHLFGFFSTFNTDAVKDLKLYKGGFPAQYSGRLSSVIDVKLKEGNNKKFAGSGGLGLIASRLTLEGPIQKDRSSFIISGRRTYVDLITKSINRANEGKEDTNPIPDYYFYDLNTKINWKLGEKDHLFLSGYFGRDVFGFSGDFFDFSFDWGNATGTARWNHIFGPKLFSNTTFTFSDYQYNIENKVTSFSFNLGSKIRDINVKSDFYNVIDASKTLRFGARVTQHTFDVGRLKAGSDDGTVSFSSGQDYASTDAALYVAYEWQLLPELKFNTGLSTNAFATNGQTYWRAEPRIAASLDLGSRSALKASYSRMHQFLHLIANSGVALPTDVWYPSTKKVPPQRSDQVALGWSYLINKQWFFNTEVYYKKLENQLEFIDGAELFANNDLENEIAIGDGEGYGWEVSIEKKEGKLNGWIGYTLASINRGNFRTIDPAAPFYQTGYFSPIYDRRHDISVVASYELSRRINLSATFVYGSGDIRWLPTGRFTYQDTYGGQSQAVVPLYQNRNNYRLPAYHRLDFGLIWTFFPKWGESDLTFNIINVYDRRNTFFLYLEPIFKEQTDVNNNLLTIPERIAAKQVSLFPILPAITYNFKF